MKGSHYHIENYWNNVAQQITHRKKNQLLAGDDEPYYVYKRALFLKELDKINFKDKKVLEFGCGPGGNLYYLQSRECKRIAGVDISENMINIAKENFKGTNVELKKIDGVNLPFEDNEFDLIFTSTVLQHIVDNAHLEKVVREITRVSKKSVILFERTEKKETSNYGRTTEYYISVLKKNSFNNIGISFLKIKISYLLCGVSRKLFDRNKNEGEKSSFFNYNLQKVILFFTKKVDRFFNQKRDLTKIEFEKNDSNL